MNGRLTQENVDKVLGQNGPHTLVVHPCLIIHAWVIAAPPVDGNIWYVVSNKDMSITGHLPWKLLDRDGAVVYESDGSSNKADKRHDRAGRRREIVRSLWDWCGRRRPEFG